MYLRNVTIGLFLAITACNESESGNASATTGGSGASGGNSDSTNGGQANVAAQGGASTNNSSATDRGGTSPNTPPVGGATGVTSTVVPGSPCSANCPIGTVIACFGEGCPFGACDNSGFYASASCSSIYATPTDSKTTYCTSGQTSSYCLKTQLNDLSYWAVTCVDGNPKVEFCASSCLVSSTGAAC